MDNKPDAWNPSFQLIENEFCPICHQCLTNDSSDHSFDQENEEWLCGVEMISNTDPLEVDYETLNDSLEEALDVVDNIQEKPQKLTESLTDEQYYSLLFDLKLHLEKKYRGAGVENIPQHVADMHSAIGVEMNRIVSSI